MLATDMVQVDSSYQHVFYLDKNGTLHPHQPENPESRVQELVKNRDQFRNVVWFEAVGNGGAALTPEGKILNWGKLFPQDFLGMANVAFLNPNPGTYQCIQIDGKASGVVVHCPDRSWMPWLEEQRDLVQIQASWHHMITLTSKGKVQGWFATLEPPSDKFPEEERRAFNRIRDGVRLATHQNRQAPATLVLLSSGEILPFFWPAKPDGGSWLPEDLPRDIDSLSVLGLGVGGGDPAQPLGAVHSQTQGWFFFGPGAETIGVEKLKAAADGLVSISLFRSDRLLGIRPTR